MVDSPLCNVLMATVLTSTPMCAGPLSWAGMSVNCRSRPSRWTHNCQASWGSHWRLVNCTFQELLGKSEGVFFFSLHFV